eukprot:672845-Pleurochrysis_carterae.AAC.2
MSIAALTKTRASSNRFHLACVCASARKAEQTSASLGRARASACSTGCLAASNASACAAGSPTLPARRHTRHISFASSLCSKQVR